MKERCCPSWGGCGYRRVRIRALSGDADVGQRVGAVHVETWSGDAGSAAGYVRECDGRSGAYLPENGCEARNGRGSDNASETLSASGASMGIVRKKTPTRGSEWWTCGWKPGDF